MIIKKIEPFKLVVYDEPTVARNYVKFNGSAPVGEFEIPEGATIQVIEIVPEGSLYFEVTNYETKLIDSNGNEWLEINDL